jgi:hypothetical protein
MLKLASLTLGLLTMMLLVPSSQAATTQNQPPLLRINGAMYSQRLVPIRKSSKLKTTVILNAPVSAPRANKFEISPADRSSQRQVECQREMNASQRIGATERPVGLSGRDRNSVDKSNQLDLFPHFNNTAAGNCNFSGKF